MVSAKLVSTKQFKRKKSVLMKPIFIKTAEAVKKYNGWIFVHCVCMSIYNPMYLCLHRDLTPLNKFTTTCWMFTYVLARTYKVTL
jgi:hypothetical protein